MTASIPNAWLEQLVRDPVGEIAAFLAGYAPIGVLSRASAPEAALRLFSDLESDDPALSALDVGILAWLNHRRGEPAPRDPDQLQGFVREICEAFMIVGLLERVAPASAMLSQFLLWNNWASRFVLAPQRDARVEFWRMLALTEPARAASHKSFAPPRDLVPLWQRICESAGKVLPRRYLDIGLLGLRLANVEDDTTPWLTGLALWAQENSPSDKEFRQEWFALRELYPFAPRFWHPRIVLLLSASRFRDNEAPAWWSVDPQLARMFTGKGRRVNFERLRSPMPLEAENLVNRIKDEEPLAQLLPTIGDLFERHVWFARRVGDGKHLLPAIHMVGAELAARSDDTQQAARIALVLVKLAMAWDSHNPYIFSVWRNALTALKEFDVAELVGWESIRRMPQNAVSWCQLAMHISVAMNRPDEACAILTYAIELFPDNSGCVTELAMIKAEALDQWDDAIALLEAAHAAMPANPAPASQLASYLIRHRKDADRAATVLEAAIALNYDAKLSMQLAFVLGRIPSRRGEAIKLWGKIVQADPGNARARFWLGDLLTYSGVDDLAAAEHFFEVLKIVPEDPKSRAKLYQLAEHNPQVAERLTMLRSTAPAVARDHSQREAFGELDQLEEFWGNVELTATWTKFDPEGGLVPELEGDEPLAATSTNRNSAMAADATDGDLAEQSEARQARSVTVAHSIAPAPLDALIARLERFACPESELEIAVEMGRLRRTRFRIERIGGEARERAMTELGESSETTYSEMLRIRHNVDALPADGLPSFCVAFERALRNEDRAALEALGQTHNRQHALTLVAQAVLGDEAAQAQVEQEIKRAGGKAPQLPHIMWPVLALFNSGLSMAQAFKEGQALVLDCLHNDNEALEGRLFVA